MRTRTKVLIVAVPVVLGVAAGAVAAHRIRQRMRKGRVMPSDVRTSLEELMQLKGEDFVPDGLGTSLYQRKLQTLTDAQLLSAYALVKVGETLHARGVDLHRPTRAERKQAAAELRAVMEGGRERDELVAELGSFGADVVRGVMQDALLVVGR